LSRRLQKECCEHVGGNADKGLAVQFKSRLAIGTRLVEHRGKKAVSSLGRLGFAFDGFVLFLDGGGFAS
jgi:hypothetical protein